MDLLSYKRALQIEHLRCMTYAPARQVDGLMKANAQPIADCLVKEVRPSQFVEDKY